MLPSSSPRSRLLRLGERLVSLEYDEDARYTCASGSSGEFNASNVCKGGENDVLQQVCLPKGDVVIAPSCQSAFTLPSPARGGGPTSHCAFHIKPQ